MRPPPPPAAGRRPLPPRACLGSLPCSQDGLSSCVHCAPGARVPPRHPPFSLSPCRAYGSAILRTAVWGIVAAAPTVLLYVLRQDHLTRYFTEGGHVMAYTVFSGLMSLLVIFRQNAG